MRLSCLSLSSVGDDMLQIFFKRLFCDWQSEWAICEDVLVSSFFAIMPNVSHSMYDLMQTHVIPYSLVGFVHAFQVRIYTCISRSREHKCPNYIPLEGKMICPYWYTHEDIRDFESNNSIKCCHEVRIGRQNVHANKVYSGKEKKKGIPYPNLQKVSGLLCPSL